MAFPYGTIYGKRGAERVVSTTNPDGNPLGTVMVLPDGRVFRLALAGGAIGPGKLVQQAATSTTYDADIAVAAAAAIGATSVSLTNAGATLAVDDFKFGTMRVNDVDGEGHYYHIRTHEAATTTANFTVFLEEGDDIEVALTTNSQVGLRKHPYDDVVVYPTTFTGMPLGVAPVDVASGEYFWCQVYGECTILSDAVVWAAGQPIVPSFSVAGAARIIPKAFTTSGARGVIGWAQDVSVTTEYGLAFLTIGAP